MADDKYIGALWVKKSKKGQDFFSGNVEVNGIKVDIVVFRNNKDGNEKRPDYQILKSEPREYAEDTQQSDRDDTAKTQEVVTARDDEIDVDSIPF